MTDLITEVVDAHGGIARWRAITSISGRGRFGGILRSRMPGNRMADVDVRIEMDEQRAVFSDFPTIGQRAVFDEGDVRIETADGEVLATRLDARKAFTGIGSLRRNVRWDPLDAGYFAGYAWWNYLSLPLLLTRDDVVAQEGDPWRDGRQTWRRLEVTFPRDFHTHSRRQTFYVDSAGLIRRHDYVAEPIGRWARAAHYSDDHRAFDGLIFPTRRRVFPIGPRGRALPGPTLVALDIDDVHVETS